MAILRSAALVLGAFLLLAAAAPQPASAQDESPVYLCEVHDAGGFVGMFVFPTEYSENPILDILLAAGAEDAYFLDLAAAFAAVGDTRMSELMLYGMGGGEVFENWYMNTDDAAPYLFISITGDLYEVMFFALQGSSTPFCAYLNDASRGVSPLGMAMTYFPLLYWRAELTANELSAMESELKRISTEWSGAAPSG